MDTPRTLSHWGWGFADGFPDRDAREGHGLVAASLMGLEGPREMRDPVPLADVTLPAPRIPAPSGLEALCRGDADARIRHTYGRSYPDQVEGFYGRYPHPPDWVCTPETEAQIGDLLAWAEGASVAVIPFGGGTSVVGGVSARVGARYRGVVSLDMAGLTRLLEVDSVSRRARFQGGIKGPALEDALRPHGLTLRHYPQSFEFSTLGGWIVTRAGGHFATLYTHIDDLVAGVRMVTPRGIFESRPLPASGAGPRPEGLVLGSEGIFGVVTEATVRLRPRPSHRLGATLYFDTFEAGIRAVRDIAQAGLYPANCRLLDPGEALLNGVSDGEAVLILGFESGDHPVGPGMDRALSLALAAGGRCPKGVQDRGVSGAGSGGGGGAETWKRAFLHAPYLQPILISCGIMADTFETCVSWTDFPALDAALRARVGGALERLCGGGRLTCRFTHVYPDGPAPYYTFLGAVPFGGELEIWRQVKAAACDTLAEFGATITHHHAVGRVHRPWYVRETPGPMVAMLKGAKGQVDPGGILNPGVLIPEEGGEGA